MMTDLEMQVAELWREILEMLDLPAGAIMANSNFLELGGDSLTAAEMRRRLQEQYAVEVPVSELFESVTVAQLAALIEHTRTSNGRREATGPEIEEGEL